MGWSVLVYQSRPWVSLQEPCFILQTCGQGSECLSVALTGCVCRHVHMRVSSWGSVYVGCVLSWSHSGLD